MNKLVILFCLLAIGLFIGDSFALNAPAMQGGNPESWYIEVEFNAPTGIPQSASHGDVLEWDLEADDGETLGYTVHKCDEAAASHAAGVIPSYDDTSHGLQTAVRDGDVFLMQIYGYHKAINCTVDVAEGDTISAGIDGTVDDDDGMGFALDAAVVDTTNVNAGYSAQVWLNMYVD